MTKTDLFKRLSKEKYWMPLISSAVNEHDIDMLLAENDDVEYCKFIARSMRQRCHALENELAQKNECIEKIEDISERLFVLVLKLIAENDLLQEDERNENTEGMPKEMLDTILGLIPDSMCSEDDKKLIKEMYTIKED